MRLIVSKQFTKSVWTYKIAIVKGSDFLVLGGFYFGHTSPVNRFDQNKYWYFYLYPPCIRKEGLEIAKIGFTTDKGAK